MQKNVIFTLRNVLYRGFLDEEEDWKKKRRDGEDGRRMKKSMEFKGGRTEGKGRRYGEKRRTRLGGKG
jgi:hypothetical protein